MRRARLLLADDHPVVIAGLRDVLEPKFEVAGTAADGRALVDLAPVLKPDAVLLDIAMPLLNGLTAARQIKKELPKVKLIFLTMHSEADYVREAFRTGASGYVLKQSVASELVGAIEEVLKGRTYLSPVLAKTFNGPLPVRSARGRTSSTELTDREREVLQPLAEGHPSKVIAALLHVTVKTVEFHKAMIKRKLHLHTTADLIRYAIEHRINGA